MRRLPMKGDLLSVTSKIALLGLLLLTPSISGALTCPAGQHAVCRGGSGRGGGYRTTCSCVTNPPPRCVTAWGTHIPAGTSIILYATYLVYAPDTCSAHGMVVSCDLNGVLSPPNAMGYPVCSVVVYDPSDDPGED
jgi:hypothetical protein